jgi:putative redox protein
MPTIAQAGAQLVPPSMQATIQTGGHRLIADEPVSLGGHDAGPTPIHMLLGALASCTAITIAMYLKHKGWSVERVGVEALGHRQNDQPGPLERITLSVTLGGGLSDEQRARIMAVAARCPVHRTLSSGVAIETQLV